jgi:protease YdgD
LLLLGAGFFCTSVAAQHRQGTEVFEARAAVPSAVQKGSQHSRVPISSDPWPWSAVGRVNIAVTTQRSFCTGTLVGPRTVVTAAHCLVDERLSEWVKPEAIHFVAGLSPSNRFIGHSTVRNYVTSPAFLLGSQTASRPDYQYRRQGRLNSIQSNTVKNDWAILTLVDALEVRTIPIEPVPNADLPSPGRENKIVLPGYGADRPFLLSISRDCSARTDVRELGEGSLVHSCDTFRGGSGSPVLLLQNGSAMLIGISTAATFDGTPNTPAHGGLGVSATAFVGAISVP